MNLFYFTRAKSYDEAKSLYKNLAKSLHPDKGGKHEEFVELNNQWQYIELNKDDASLFFIPREQASQAKTAVSDAPKYVNHKELIDNLCYLRQLKGHKKGWIYYLFVQTVEFHNEEITRADLQYLAFKLEYTEGWIYHKIIELKIKS